MIPSFGGIGQEHCLCLTGLSCLYSQLFVLHGFELQAKAVIPDTTYNAWFQYYNVAYTCLYTTLFSGLLLVKRTFAFVRHVKE